ncbi:MAG: glyoxalase [Desulfobacterales bacterium]|nr:MAG: glyoxalase [Desulfobacterales bacterium]
MDRELLKHGAISWFELMTTDVEAAKKFYGEIFGWEYTPFAQDPSHEYHSVSKNGREFAGIMKTPKHCGDIPPCWGGYVTVDDIDVTAARVTELGGKIIVPPTEIPGIGRFSVFSDPQGAVISAITYVSKGSPDALR